MLRSNRFANLTAFMPAWVMQAYVVLIAIAVAVGTLLDAYHKRSAKYYFQRKEKARADLGAARYLGDGRTQLHRESAVPDLRITSSPSVCRHATVHARGNARPRAARPRTR